VSAFVAREAGYRYGRQPALRDVSFTIERGEIVGIGGRNGAGKSTLVRVLAGLLRGFAGEVRFSGKPLHEWKRSELATRIAYLAQQSEIPFPYRALEIVLMGRLPHQRGVFDSERDVEIARESLESVGAGALAARPFSELSGGERQLVLLASALAQQPEVLLLDEPTAFLDLNHRVRFTRLLRALRDRHGLTVLLVTHDVELAAAFCDRMLLLKAGRLAHDLRRDAGGHVPLTSDVISGVFEIAPNELPVRLLYT
jgi:iron complex transport system ATP-binding protein